MNVLDRLTALFSKLPGIGKKTAGRLVYHILDMDALQKVSAKGNGNHRYPEPEQDSYQRSHLLPGAEPLEPSPVSGKETSRQLSGGANSDMPK